MGIKSVHPCYNAMQTPWEECRDSYEGEPVIKAKGSTYLPPTSGMNADGAGRPGTEGDNAFKAYVMRSVYPDIYKESVDAAIGIMHRKAPNIELPPQLESMLERATLTGESLEMLLRRINARQLTTGRIGLLGDIRVVDGKAVPVIATYNELAIRNWDDTSVEDDDLDLRLVVLDESGYEMNAELDWVHGEKYRILALVAGDEEGAEFASEGEYRTALLKESDVISAAVLEAPNVQGQVMEQIPFCFVNAKDISSTPDRPPLSGLASLCFAIYRGEADYRQNLFMQGQDTLVRIGVTADDEKPVRVGAGAHIDVPVNGDAKYIGTNSQGLSEQRTALENDYARAYQKSGQLTDATSRAKESGDALRIRVAAQTATLPQIALAGAAGLERVLRALAVWMGADPEKVIVTPNLEFSDNEFDGKTLVDIVAAKASGAPLSNESIHAWLKEKGLTELEFKAEVAKILAETPLIGGMTLDFGDDPAGNGNNAPPAGNGNNEEE